MEQLNNAAFQKVKEENEKLNNKIFILENIITKKDGLIEGYIKKIAKMNKSSFYNMVDDINAQPEREIYITEPSVAVNQIHDELQMYKKIYDKLSIQIKEMKKSISKLQKTNTDLENQVVKLKKDLKLNNLTIKYNQDNASNINQNTRNTIINLNKTQQRTEDNNEEVLKTDNSNYTKNRNLTPISPNLKTCKSDNNILQYKSSTTNASNNSQINLQILRQYENYEENTRIIKEKPDLADEWVETLKHCNMTQVEFIKYSRNKLMSKLVEALEYLYKIITDKNMQIRILTTENENLNSKNLALNKENILLYEQNALLMQEKNLEMEKSEKIRNNILAKGDTGMNTSLINNTSRLTVKENEEKSRSGSPSDKVNQDKVNKNYLYTNTLESITSNDFREGMLVHEASFISETNNTVGNDIQNIIYVDKIKDS